MAKIVYNPAPVNVNVTVPPIGPIDRAPAPVDPGLDAELPQPSLSAAIPEIVSTTVQANTTPTSNVIINQPAYLTVLNNGTIVARQVTSLNFLGSGISSITGGNNSANITISGGGSGPGNYDNSNVAAFLAAFGSNSIITTGNIAAGNVDVSNVVASENIYSVRGTFTGDTNTGDNSLYIGSPSFTNLGTDVMAQFTGNVGSYGQINFQNYSNSPTATGDYIATADNGNDSTHYIDMGITSSTWDGTQENSLGNALSAGDGYLYVQDGNLALAVKDGEDQHVWKMDLAGGLTLPTFGVVRNSTVNIVGSQYAQLQWIDSANIGNANPNDSTGPKNWVFVDDQGFTVETNINTGEGNSRAWSFGNDGNVTVPNNMVMQTRETGYPFSSNIVGIVTGESTVTVILAGNSFPGPVIGQVTITGVVGTTEAIDTWWFQAVEGNAIELFTDSGLTTPVDGTTWTAYENGGFAVSSGSADLVVKGGNVSIIGGTWTWTFDATGNLSLPGGGAIVYQDNTSILITNANVQDGEITLEANTDVNLYGGSPTTPGQGGGGVNLSGGDGGADSGEGVGSGGDVELSGGSGASAINDAAGIGGDVRIVGGSGGAANSGNSIPAETGGKVYIFGGQAGDVDGDNSLAVNGPNVEIHGGLGSFNGSTMVGIPGDVITQGGGDGWIGASGNVLTKTSPDGYDFYVWKYDNAGQTIFPTLSTQRGDNPSGTISGYTIRIGDGAAEAIITTPDGVEGNEYSQRLVINPGAGSNFGEGGDIYLWAGRGGDGSGSGGDIKIRGGQGGANTNGGTGGAGGYIRMEAGDAASVGGDPGYIEITAGSGGSGSPGGYVHILAGTGATGGGEANLTGGYAQNGLGGQVNITGGISADGLGSYGNVVVSAGASGWTFDNTGVLLLPNGDTINNGAWTGTASSTVSMNAVSPDGNTVSFQAQGNTSTAVIQTYSDGTDTEYNWAFDNAGNLTLPQGGVVYETNIPFGGLSGKTIALKPYGGIDADQQLLVYPTAGQDFNHLHLTTGNLWNTEMFLGNDDFYVRLANTGNVVINTNNNGGNTAQWTFDTTGAIAASGDLTLQTPNGIPGAVTAITGSSGSWEQNPVSNLATTGGTGTGLTVNVTQEGGYAGTIAIATPGTGYSDGDAISVVSGSSSASFTISVLANSWVFGTDGNFSLNGSNIAGATSTVVNDGINSIALGAGATMDVYGFPFSGGGIRGQLTITGDITTTQALGTWYYQSTGTYIYQLYTDSTYSTLVDASGWTAYTGGGSVAITKQSPASNVVINSNGYFSTFGTDGTLDLPGNLGVVGDIGTDGDVIATGNVSGGNINSTGNVYAPNIKNGDTGITMDAGYPGYINFFNATGTKVTFGDGGDVSAVGNVTGANIITAGNVVGNTAGYAIGYRDIPQISFTGNATIATTSAGKHYYSTQSSNYILTIANNASQGLQVGTAITVVNQGTGTITVAQGSGVTLYIAGNATSGNRSISTFGMATLIKVATDTWFINGTGVS